MSATSECKQTASFAGICKSCGGFSEVMQRKAQMYFVTEIIEDQ